MKKLILLAVLALLASLAGVASAAKSAEPPYVLRDTIAFLLPDSGMARLVVSRERTIEQSRKPEFVFVDGTPAGMLPQKTGLTALVPAGMHRVWLGRGVGAEVWIPMAPGGRYLVRMREAMIEGAWRADLVLDGREGYAEFARKKGLKLA